MPNSNPVCSPEDDLPTTCSDLDLDYLGSKYHNLCLSGDVQNEDGPSSPLTLSYDLISHTWRGQTGSVTYYITCIESTVIVWELYWGSPTFISGSESATGGTFPNFSTAAGEC